MRNFLVLVNILALTLPFLAAQMQSLDPAAAEVQTQEQVACPETNGHVFEQKRVLPTPVHYVPSSSAQYDPSLFQYRSPIAVSPYGPYAYLVKLLVLRPPVQISKWQIFPNIPQLAAVPHPYPRPSFLAIPTNGNQDKNTTPTTNTAASVEPTPVPVAQPVVSTVASPEASTVVAAATETATVPVSSPAVENH